MDDDWTTMGDLFRGRRARQQAKRAQNTEDSTRMLTERGVPFTSHNAGAHLIVAQRWDFWPGTGLFNERRGRAGHPKRTGRGVRNLLKLIEEDGHGAT
jgi:hypothetical protein